MTGLTLNVNITKGESDPKIVALPTNFTNQADLREYLGRLAESKLDDIAQDLAKKIDGGFVLQTPIQDQAYEKFTERIEKPGTMHS